MSDETPLTPKQELEMRVYAFALYCEDRQAFALTAQRLSSLLGIVSGTALVAVARSDNPLFSLVFGFATVLLSGIVLVFDMPGVARVHGELRKRLVDLGQRVEGGDDLAASEAEFHKTYADCPLIFHAADALAYNAMQESRGRKSRLPVTLWQRMLRNVWRFNSNTFCDRGAG